MSRRKSSFVGQTEMFSKIPGSLSDLLQDNDYKQFLKNLGLNPNDLRLNERLDDKKFMNDLIHGKGGFAPIGGILAFLEEEEITIEMLQQRNPEYRGYKDWSDYFKNNKFEGGIYHLMWDIFNSIPKLASHNKTKKKTKRGNKRCKECRCKPCKCEEEIHCYQINYDKKTKKKKKKSREGGYPFWFDDVPKGMSRDQYKRLEGTKPKNKSMEVWIRENKKNMKKYTKKRKSQKGGFLPLCLPCWAGPAIAATGLGGAGYMVSRSSSSKTINGKTVSERKESYEIKKDGKKIKKVYEQKNNKIYLNGKELKPRPKTMKEATKRLNKRIKECIKSGFTKC